MTMKNANTIQSQIENPVHPQPPIYTLYMCSCIFICCCLYSFPCRIDTFCAPVGAVLLGPSCHQLLLQSALWYPSRHSHTQTPGSSGQHPTIHSRATDSSCCPTESCEILYQPSSPLCGDRAHEVAASAQHPR